MSIVGIGVDIVNIKRIEKLLSADNEHFLSKIFHKNEKKERKLTANSVAKKFAAKEAFAKSLGTGIGKTINFNEICIEHSKTGAPKIKLDKNVEKRILLKLKLKKIRFFLSISDDYPFAIATVIISR
tara:strand:+ start:4349 stop:4729 length:381 start_codon:yes stop_codon:yes gene_type:complete